MNSMPEIAIARKGACAYVVRQPPCMQIFGLKALQRTEHGMVCMTEGTYHKIGMFWKFGSSGASSHLDGNVNGGSEECHGVLKVVMRHLHER